ncbi:MAG: hypothetical protein RLY20_2088 [Verrucomicrobiota bacterium]|jgi:hypothetical protein
MKSGKYNSGSWLLPFLLGNALMLVLVTPVILAYWRNSVPPSDDAARSSVKLTLPQWGRVEATDLPLAGADQIESLYASFMAEPKWRFNGVSKQQLLRYFLSFNLPFRGRQMLINPANWQEVDGGVVITPPESAVYALDTESRSHIYKALSLVAGNVSQIRPIILPYANLDERLRGIGLTESQIAVIRKLSFTRNGMLCFSDFGIASKILGERAFDNFVEFIYAVPACRVRLKIDSSADIDALAEYWGRGGRTEFIKPLLKSIARMRGGGDINISYLLPDFARLHLYRYPGEYSKLDGGAAGSPDCFYSAMNFFSTNPDPKYFKPEEVNKTIQRDFEVVPNASNLGDVIMLLNDEGKYMHACVFIAGDLVFTKNGITSLQPWTLMRLDDLLGIYYRDKKTAKIQVLHNKALDHSENALASVK